MDKANDFYEKSFDVKIDVNEMSPALMGWFPSHPEALVQLALY